MSSASSSTSAGRRDLRDALNPATEITSPIQAVSKAIIGGKDESTRLLAGLAPAIMTPRMITAAASSRSARGSRSTISTSSSRSPLDLTVLGRAPMRLGFQRRMSARDLQVIEETPSLLLKEVPEPEGVAQDVSLLRGFQATIPASERGKSRRRAVRNVDVPHLGLKQLGMRARGMLDEPEDELGSKSDDDMVLVGRTRKSKSKSKAQRRGRESLSATVALGRDELLLQTKEIMVDKENIHVRRTLINSEIDEITRKIDALGAARTRLADDLLHLHEDELELDDEMEGVRERLSYEEARHPLAGRQPSGQAAAASSRRRKGLAFLPTEHNDLPSGVAFMSVNGHNGAITALDMSEPYGLLVTASQDESTRLWDLCSGEEISRLRGHSGTVKCVQIEDHVCLTGGADSTLRMWDLRLVDDDSSQANGTGETAEGDEFGRLRSAAGDQSEEDPAASEPAGCTRVLRGHSKAVTALYFEDSCLVTGADDKTLRQWDLSTGQCVVSMDILWEMSQASSAPSWMARPNAPFSYCEDGEDEYTNFVGAVQFWGYGLISGSGDGAVRMWDMRTGQSHRSLVGHTAPITSLQFDEVNIVSGSLDKTIRIWDLRTGGVLETLRFDHGVTSLQFDTRKILACTGDRGISTYNRTTQQQSVLMTNGHTQSTTRLRYMDLYMVSGGKDNVVKVWAL
ncbi:WD40 repeat-like protein [Auriculariales sp. MPI-PUGE-AT-0066]|nr:WD40 repeat-like protein [Auriculariales sp. MPI-PUGE-AT-0066]